jgi:hypothetical protein
MDVFAERNEAMRQIENEFLAKIGCDVEPTDNPIMVEETRGGEQNQLKAVITGKGWEFVVGEEGSEWGVLLDGKRIGAFASSTSFNIQEQGYFIVNNNEYCGNGFLAVLANRWLAELTLEYQQ